MRLQGHSPTETGVQFSDRARACHGAGTKLSVIVPCYNEQDALPELYRRLTAVCEQTCGTNYEIILVDDGSSDTTWELISQLSSQDLHVFGAMLSRNHGHQIALTAGLGFAQGDMVLIIDADLQDPPELLPEMIAGLDDGYDVIYGRRRTRPGETKFKLRSAYLFYRMLNILSDVYIPEDAGDFRLMKRRVVDAVLSMPERYRFLRGMVSWVGFAHIPIHYDRAPRSHGTTKYPVKRMIGFAFDAITGFSITPLRIASYLGLVFAALGVMLFLYVLLAWITETTVAGWTSLMVVVLVVGSVQLLVVGVLGEYIGRIYLEVKRRPLYIIDQVTEAGRREK